MAALVGSVRRARRAAARGATARQAFFGQVAPSFGCSTAGPAQFAFSGATGPLHAVEPASRRLGSDVAMHLLMPKNIKWKKPHKPIVKPFRHCTKWKFRGMAPRGNTPFFGKYALQACEEAWISNKAIENVRRCIVRTMERKGKMWVRVFPHRGITKRVAESRFGAGKGSIEYWVAAVRPGFILFEIDGVAEDVARHAFHKSAARLPCKTKFLRKVGPSQFELGLAGKEAGKGKKEGIDPRTKTAGATRGDKPAAKAAAKKK